MTDLPPLEKLLPHRGNMLLVKSLEYADLKNMRSSALAELGKDCLFYDRGRNGLPSEISIEIMAQGAGLLYGYREYLQGKSGGECAMILSIKRYEIFCDTIPADTPLRTTNEITSEEYPISVCDCELHLAESNILLAHAEITAYKP